MMGGPSSTVRGEDQYFPQSKGFRGGRNMAKYDGDKKMTGDHLI